MKNRKIKDHYPLNLVIASREVGIEIEMEGSNLQISHSLIPSWRQTGDGSLRGEGIEYRFAQPFGRKRVLSKLQELLIAANKTPSLKWNPSVRCGVHVHVNVQHMTHQEVLNFGALYLAVEAVLLNWCGDTRNGNLFCLDAQSAEGLAYQLIHAAKQENFDSIISEHFRYASINFSSLYKFGSLEFRAMETPADIMKIDKWVKLLLAVRDASLSYDSPGDIVKDASAKGYKTFLKNIMGPLYSWVSCPEVEDLLLQGIRTTQDIAYLAPPVELRASPQIFSGPRRERYQTRRNREMQEAMDSRSGRPRGQPPTETMLRAMAARPRDADEDAEPAAQPGGQSVELPALTWRPIPRPRRVREDTPEAVAFDDISETVSGD